MGIFEDYLSPSAIEAMSLVCKTLRSLALPLIFHRLELSLVENLDLEGDEDPEPYDEDELLLDDRQLERLEFFTSDAIRNLVRVCAIKSYSGLSPRAEAIDPNHHKISNQTTILIEKYLSYLFNLETLEFADTYFDEGSLEALLTLPTLRSLTLDDCTIRLAAPLLSPLRLQLRFLSLNSTASSPWDALVDLGHLETLAISFGIVPTWLPARDLPHLRHLYFLHCNVPPGYPPMRPLPQLEVLSYYPASDPPLIFSGVPKLKEYRGPPRSIFPSLNGGTIEKLVVFLEGETRDVAQGLREMAPSNPQLRLLHVIQACLTHSLLEALCLFPALRDMRLHVMVTQASSVMIESQDEFMSKLLALPLPPLIERISISLATGHVLSGHPDLQIYTEQLLSWVGRYPELRYVEIPGWVWGQDNYAKFEN